MLFRIHFFAGLVAGLYMALIGLTGSVLVFRPELDLLRLPDGWRARHVASLASAGTVVTRLGEAHPDLRVISITAPTASMPTFVATLGGQGRVIVACDPATGAVLGPLPPPAAWMTFVRTLHETLFIRGSGRVWNGVGAVLLLVLAVTGLSNWWPGLSRWRQALSVGARFGWRRITFDLHRAVGFWTLALLVCWAVTGVYFAWTRQVFAFVDSWSPVVAARPPAIAVTPVAGVTAPELDTLVVRAAALDPGTTWGGIFFPYGRQAPLQIIMRRAGGAGREYEDTVYFDPYTGEHLATWRYGVNESLGDWLLWLQVPLHVGRSWGLAVKVVWALAGLALPLLAVTGLVMYWNRALRRHWRRVGVRL